MEENIYLDELLKLPEFIKLINNLGKVNEIEQININNIQFNDNKYIIFKNKDSFLIKCSDGRALEIKVNANDNEEEPCHDIIMDLLNGGVLLIYKLATCNNINEENYNIVYISDDWDYSKLVWNPKEEMFNYDQGITRRDNKYIYFDGKDQYTISSDLNEITGIYEKLLPSKEEIFSFTKEKEKQKLINILKNNQLNEITRNSILEIINRLDSKEKFVNQIKKAYQETVIPKCREILKQEVELSKVILNSTFTKEEINFILTYLDNKIINNKTGYKK